MIQLTKNGGGGGGLDAHLLIEQQRPNMMAALNGLEPTRQQQILATWSRTCIGMLEESYLLGTKASGASTAPQASKPAPTRSRSQSKGLVKEVAAAGSKSTTRKPSASQGNAGGAPRTQMPQAEAGGQHAAA